MLFKYPEKEPYKLLYADKNIIESIGNLVCMKELVASFLESLVKY